MSAPAYAYDRSESDRARWPPGQFLIERRRAHARRGDPPPHAAAGPAPAGAATSRSPRACDGFTRADLEAAIDPRERRQDHDHRMTLHLAAADDYPAYAQLTRQARMRAWRKRYAAPGRGAGHARADRLVLRRRARTPRSASASARYEARPGGPVDAGHLRPHAAAADPAPARGHWDDDPARRVRRRPAPAARSADAARSCSALPRPRSARRAGATSPPGPASPSATSPWRRVDDRHLPRRERAPSSSTSRAARSRPPTPAAAALSRPLGPAAARLRGPRPHHPARAQAAQPDAQRRPDRHRRRPRRRQLGAPGRPPHDHAAGQAEQAPAGRRRGRGAAPGPAVRRAPCRITW